MTTLDAAELTETSRTETTVRRLDADGQVLSETTTVVVTRANDNADDLPIGMYL